MYIPQTTWVGGVHPLAHLPELMNKKPIAAKKKPGRVADSASRPQKILDALETKGTLTMCQLAEVLQLPKAHIKHSLKTLNRFKTKRVMIESRFRLNSKGVEN